MVENISILGSTGSIGTQALDVCEKLGINVEALSCSKNIKKLEQQIRKFKPKFAVVHNKENAKILQDNIKDTNTKVLVGLDGLLEISSISTVDTILNALVGMIGLEPTMCAINAKKNIALANKETLVAGGSLVMQAARASNVKIYPVDSEHSAIFQCLQGSRDKVEVKKLILTASGGPFFGKTREELKQVTLAQALKHPNWSMGTKITIDSATMMNKGLEIIEASWLFDMPEEKIDVVVHKESIIHSMIEYADNSVIAQLGVPDMHLPIQYALTYPKRFDLALTQSLDLIKIANLSFYSPDDDTFLCLKACKEALKIGGLMPAMVNATNEIANELFQQNKISFLQIGELVYGSLNQKNLKTNEQAYTLQEVLDIYEIAKNYVKKYILER